MNPERQKRAAETLTGYVWRRYEPLSRGSLLFFRLEGGGRRRQVRIGPHGGLTWMEKKPSGRWTSRVPTGSEETGIYETLEALRAFDEQETERKRRIDTLADPPR